jgi:hypothetical protein
MIEEFAMVSALAGMGIYFIKSADLPKELKERNDLLQEEKKKNPEAFGSKKLDFNKISQRSNLREKKQSRVSIGNYTAKEVNKLTDEVSTLEQQLEINNKKNQELKKLIESNLHKISSIQNNQQKQLH